MTEIRGNMREQFMRYNVKKILSTSALALVLSLGYVHLCSAQGVVTLSSDAKASNDANEIPDEISLFGDPASEADVITPAKSASGVKSAADLLGKKKTAPAQNNNGVKSAKDLLNANKKSPAANIKSAAELLGDKKDQNISQQSANAALQLQKAASKATVKTETNTVVSEVSKTEESPAKAVIPANNIDINIVKDVEDTVFDKMSDLEKQTAILNLELKKEKVKSSIESLKAMQEKAREEEKARIEEQKRKVKEWENEQQRKLIQEQQKLKELEIAYEQERQEKILTNYKNQMMDELQKNLDARADTFKELAQLKAEREALISDFKGRFVQLTQMADKATSEAIRVRDNYAKTISDLQTQISILKARLEASENQNPFAEGAASVQQEVSDVKLNDLYAIMEVRGQGNALVAKLINESGIPFLVKVGTALQSGHIVDEITPTYVRADKNGVKDYLYFSAGGILEQEPQTNEDLQIKVSSEKAPTSARPAAIVTNGIPNVASEMTVR